MSPIFLERAMMMVLLLRLQLSSASVAGTFSATVAPNGEPVCAADAASGVTYASDIIQCGIGCVSDSSCFHFNYIESTKTCELFQFKPTSFQVVHGCYGNGCLVCRISPPTVMSVDVGMDVKLECQRSSPMVRWKFIAKDSQSEVIVADNCEIADAFRSHYSVDRSDQTSCHLLIAAATPHHGGTYVCQDALATDDIATCRLYVYELTPICETMPTTGSIFIGQYLTLSCMVPYRGSLASLSIQWTDQAGNIIKNATTTVEANATKSVISIPGYYPAVDKFICTVTLANMPAAISRCSTQNVSVGCPPGFHYLSNASSCYQALIEGHSWASAVNRCQEIQEGSYLAVLSSAIECNDINGYLSSELQRDTVGVCLSTVWPHLGKIVRISGERKKPNTCTGSFAWKPRPGVEFEFAYTNWDTGEPNCAFGREFCVIVWPQSSFRWMDLGCDEAICILCEFGPF